MRDIRNTLRYLERKINRIIQVNRLIKMSTRFSPLVALLPKIAFIFLNIKQQNAYSLNLTAAGFYSGFFNSKKGFIRF